MHYHSFWSVFPLLNFLKAVSSNQNPYLCREIVFRYKSLCHALIYYWKKRSLNFIWSKMQ